MSGVDVAIVRNSAIVELDTVPSAGVTHLDSKSIRLVGAEAAFTRDEVPAEFE